MGDSGSVPLGFLAGGVGIDGWLRGAWPVWFPFIVFAPFVIDASATILKRIARREKFWSAHREHYYQRLVRMGWSHRRLALGEYLLMIACGASALALLHAPATQQAIGLATWLAIYAAIMIRIDHAWARRREGPGGEP